VVAARMELLGWVDLEVVEHLVLAVEEAVVV
jgi:hypothetical protein